VRSRQELIGIRRQVALDRGCGDAEGVEKTRSWASESNSAVRHAEVVGEQQAHLGHGQPIGIETRLSPLIPRAKARSSSGTVVPR
jgi:hypothetical protein